MSSYEVRSEYMFYGPKFPNLRIDAVVVTGSSSVDSQEVKKWHPQIKYDNQLRVLLMTQD